MQTPLTYRRILDALRVRLRMACYNVGYRLHPTYDGFRLPPAKLVNLVIGTRELAWYQLGGLFMQQAISTMVRRHGGSLDSFSAILDFGCGCGRIVRWWGGARGQCEVWGSDYNPVLVAWCQKHLSSIGTFTLNGADPPLDFPDGKFGFIYSYSVFTHLSAARQTPWMTELVRVLEPGGLLLVTVHGQRVAWRNGLTPAQLEELDRQGLLVFEQSLSGTNSCSAYHSERFMRAWGSLGLELVEYLPGGVRDTSEQDMYLYRKTARSI